MTKNNQRVPPATAERWEIFWDYINSAEAQDMTEVATGSGAVSPVAPDDADHDGSCGILEFATGAAVGSAGWTGTHIFRGSTSPYLEARIKLPATAANVDFAFGFDNSTEANGSCKMAYDEDTGTWNTRCDSGDGADNDSEATAISATAGWHVLRIEVDAGAEARFYVDDVLISTLGAAGVPQADDSLRIIIDVAIATGTTESIFLDYIRVWGDRV